MLVELFWIHDTTGGAWHDADNWSLTTGGAAEGNVYPTSRNDVTFDGEGSGLCTPTATVSCRDFEINEGGASINAQFDQNAQILGCRNFLYNAATATSNIFDYTINAGGSTFTVTAMQAATILEDATIALAAACSVTSTDDTNFPHIIAADDTTFTTAITVARLQLTGAAQALEFLHGVDFTLTAYTDTDWDGDADDDVTIVSDDASQWGFVNPASMTCRYINVQDSNATNAITATDNCTDGTGNTNWTFS